jgi:hypothetical protein
LLAFFTPLITDAIGFRFGYVFAACNLLGAVIVFFFLYESSDLSLESVDDVSVLSPSKIDWNADYESVRCTTTPSANLGRRRNGHLLDIPHDTTLRSKRKPLRLGSPSPNR